MAIIDMVINFVRNDCLEGPIGDIWAEAVEAIRRGRKGFLVAVYVFTELDTGEREWVWDKKEKFYLTSDL